MSIFSSRCQVCFTLQGEINDKPWLKSYNVFLSLSLLKDRVKGLSEGGSTALGPAMAVAVGMLAKQPGSEIVLCTDGLPNIGVGSLERYGNRGNNPEFYNMVCISVVPHIPTPCSFLDLLLKPSLSHKKGVWRRTDTRWQTRYQLANYEMRRYQNLIYRFSHPKCQHQREKNVLLLC